jgi:hypothetical protein
MPDRYRYDRFGRSHKNKAVSRAKRKRKLINVKNKCKDPEVGHKGIYYTYHGETNPMTWIDVYFPSLLHKGRYFSAALITCEKEAEDRNDDAAWEVADAMFPNAELKMISRPVKRTHPKQGKSWEVDFEFVNNYAIKQEFREGVLKELNAKPRMVRPSISIDRDYWAPAIGVHAIVNTPSLTEEAIIQFIEQFRALGEPINHGVVWTGEEVEVVPARIAERHAESRGD